jgi:hypothetical protein
MHATSRSSAPRWFGVLLDEGYSASQGGVHLLSAQIHSSRPQEEGDGATVASLYVVSAVKYQGSKEADVGQTPGLGS